MEAEMLGGSVFIALLRFAISLAGTILLFSLLGEPLYDRKRMLLYYAGFSAAVLTLASIWYVIDWASCARMVAFVLYMCFVVFTVVIYREPVFLLLYKLALTFYLLAVFLIGGIEVSILFFDGNIWVDILTRVLLIGLMAVFIQKKIRSSIRGFGQYVENELEHFSVAVMIISILFGIGFILNPNNLFSEEQTTYRLFQIGMNFFLTGALQFLIFRLYLHIGKEKEYQRENQLMQFGHRLLEQNMEILEEAAEDGRRARHDVRHHNAVIAEYARRGQNEELLEYLKEYNRVSDEDMAEIICANISVNHILSAYTRKAKKENIQVLLDVELGRNLSIPGIDLVTILANAYENAIYGCKEVRKQSEERKCFIELRIRTKNNKLVILCKNTCRREAKMEHGQPKPEFTGGIGVSSIIRTAENYDGEYDFKNEDGVFIFRLIMNLPCICAEELPQH